MLTNIHVPKAQANINKVNASGITQAELTKAAQDLQKYLIDNMQKDLDTKINALPNEAGASLTPYDFGKYMKNFADTNPTLYSQISATFSIDGSKIPFFSKDKYITIDQNDRTLTYTVPSVFDPILSSTGAIPSILKDNITADFKVTLSASELTSATATVPIAAAKYAGFESASKLGTSPVRSSSNSRGFYSIDTGNSGTINFRSNDGITKTTTSLQLEDKTTDVKDNILDFYLSGNNIFIETEKNFYVANNRPTNDKKIDALYKIPCQNNSKFNSKMAPILTSDNTLVGFTFLENDSTSSFLTYVRYDAATNKLLDNKPTATAATSTIKLNLYANNDDAQNNQNAKQARDSRVFVPGQTNKFFHASVKVNADKTFSKLVVVSTDTNVPSGKTILVRGYSFSVNPSQKTAGILSQVMPSAASASGNTGAFTNSSTGPIATEFQKGKILSSYDLYGAVKMAVKYADNTTHFLYMQTSDTPAGASIGTINFSATGNLTTAKNVASIALARPSDITNTTNKFGMFFLRETGNDNVFGIYQYNFSGITANRTLDQLKNAFKTPTLDYRSNSVNSNISVDGASADMSPVFLTSFTPGGNLEVVASSTTNGFYYTQKI